MFVAVKKCFRQLKRVFDGIKYKYWQTFLFSFFFPPVDCKLVTQVFHFLLWVRTRSAMHY